MEDWVLEREMSKTKIIFDFRYIIVVMLMVGSIFYSQLMSHGKPVPIVKPLEGFPKEIGGWSGETHRFSQKVYNILGVDDSVLINYKKDNEDMISMYVGYYEDQKQGEIIHSPKNCMLGSGWQPIDISEIDISLGPRKISVTKLILEKRAQKMVVLYWYQSGNRTIANEYTQRLYFIFDSIRYNRTNAAFVRFTHPVLSDDYESALQVLESFIQKTMPILDNFLPQN